MKKLVFHEHSKDSAMSTDYDHVTVIHVHIDNDQKVGSWNTMCTPVWADE